MRKLDISNYFIEAVRPTKNKDTGEIRSEKVQVPYDVKASIISILFHPELKLKAVELMDRNKLAEKIHVCQEDAILLEDAEFDKVKRAIDTISGYSKDDVQFVERIYNAPVVDVAALAAAKKEKK
jgi:hypothetical protein